MPELARAYLIRSAFCASTPILDAISGASGVSAGQRVGACRLHQVSAWSRSGAYLIQATKPVSSGATTRAGSRSPMGNRLTPASRRPRPSRITPPVAVSESM